MNNLKAQIINTFDHIAKVLKEKNEKYGNSALTPGFFSGNNIYTNILVRMDDKIKRIRTAGSDDNEDAVLDLFGYSILQRVYLGENDPSEIAPLCEILKNKALLMNTEVTWDTIEHILHWIRCEEIKNTLWDLIIVSLGLFIAQRDHARKEEI